MNEEKLLHALEPLPGLLAAILFGSHATGEVTEESDLDVALLFDRESIPSGVSLLEWQENVGSAMGMDVDLINLNTASPILAMQVMENGRPLLNRSPDRLLDYETRMITDYADLKRLRKPIEEDILKRRYFSEP